MSEKCHELKGSSEQILSASHSITDINQSRSDFAFWAQADIPLVWGRCSVALDRAYPAVAMLLSSSKWRRETPRWQPT